MLITDDAPRRGRRNRNGLRADIFSVYSRDPFGLSHCTASIHTPIESLIMSAEEVASAFVQHFYNTFDSNAEQLSGLYVRTTEQSQQESALKGDIRCVACRCNNSNIGPLYRHRSLTLPLLFLVTQLHVDL